jgi:integrase
VAERSVTLAATDRKGWRADERKEKSLMARRHFQTGCLTKKGKVWVFRYREYQIHTDGTIRPVHKSISLGRIKWSEAVCARDDFLRKHCLHGNRPRAAMTLNDFWSQYFQPQIVQKKRLNTQKLYTHLYRNHIGANLGSLKLCDLSRYDIQAFISQKQAEGYSPQTIAHMKDVLSKMLGTAALWGWLDENPTKGVTLPRMERRRVPRVLTFEEIGKLSDALREPARTIVVLGVLLGLRIGELLGLKVEDVNLEAQMLNVRRSVCRGEVGPAKTASSERRFPLPPQIVGLIRQYLAQRSIDSDWLFPTLKGNCHNDRTLFVRYILPTIRELRIAHFSWHSMRRTFLTYNGNEGVSMPVLQSLAGHTNAQTTLRYIETFAEQKRIALRQWANQLFPNVLSLGLPAGTT